MNFIKNFAWNAVEISVHFLIVLIVTSGAVAVTESKPVLIGVVVASNIVALPTSKSVVRKLRAE